MEKKLGYNIYQCQMVSSGVVSNGVEWCGVKWCRVSVMTLESLHTNSLHIIFHNLLLLLLFSGGGCDSCLKSLKHSFFSFRWRWRRPESFYVLRVFSLKKEKSKSKSLAGIYSRPRVEAASAPAWRSGNLIRKPHTVEKCYLIRSLVKVCD